jgi:two-component system sensor histidine kinase/response regulator
MPDPSGQHDPALVVAGRAIRDHSYAIVERWLDRVERTPLGASDHRHHLRDHLPQLMDRIGTDLMQGQVVTSEASEEMAEKHGRQRWQLGWNLQDVVRDYQTLRPVITEYLLANTHIDMTPAIQARIASLIDESIVDSVRSFVEFQENVENASYRTASEFAAIISSSADAIISMSVDGTIQSWNHAAEKIYGYSVEEALGQSGSIVYPPDLRHEFDTLLETIREGGSIQSTDTERVTKSGERVALAVSASPIRNRAGDVVGCSSIAHDISDRVRAADALKRALEAAEAASRTKNQFLANVSHELRSPMNAILGMTSLALDEELTPEVRDSLLTAREAVTQLNQLVDDLLDVSKLEAGKFTLEDGPFSLRRALEDTMRQASLRAYQKGIEIACHIDNDVPDALIGDALRLQQILNNLVSNAVKFTEQGEVLVEVGLVDADAEECSIAFRVSDTGIGIAESDKDRIFAPFAQADASSTRQFGGTGLGLSIASHLVACLGGNLVVDSKLGDGSVFSFVGHFHIAGEASAIQTPRGPARLMQQLRAVVVDDHDTNREIVRELLNNWGIRSRSFGTAGEALAELQRAMESGEPYELAIVDALMPEKDGFSLLADIQELGGDRPACILMISSSDRMILRERCERANSDAYLEKPVSQSSLFNAIAGIVTAGEIVEQESNTLGDLAVSGKSLSVLVVEDTQANRKVVQRVLEKRGHACTLADNGREAFELVRNEKYDVILMDVQMPIMDGFQATAAIRAWEAKSGVLPTPIIAITAHAMQGDRDRCLAAGMTDYIAKPLDILELAQVIERHGAYSSGSSSSPIDPNASSASVRALRPQTESFDLGSVMQRLRGDRGLLADLAQCYIEDYPGLLEALKQALEAGNYSEARRNSHSIKGLALNFDARLTAQIAAAMEQDARDNNLPAVAARVPELEQACEVLADLLKPYTVVDGPLE